MIAKEIFYEKKLSEILDLDEDKLEETYKNDILKLKEILKSSTDYIVLKIVEDNLYTSINNDLYIKNIELKQNDIEYIIKEIDIKKFFIFYETLKSNDIKLLIELNEEIKNINYKDYEELFQYFEKEVLTEEYVKLIKDYYIKNITQFKVLKHLNLQLDKYKKYTLKTIKDLL